MGAGARRPVGRTGASGRRRRPQVRPSHEWVPGRWWDPSPWTMRQHLLGLLRRPSFQGVSEASVKGLFGCHYWNTPEAGGKVDKDTPTHGPGAARHRVVIPAYSPRLVAHVRHSEAPAPGTFASPTWPGPTASSSSCHNTTPASRPRPRAPPSSPSPAGARPDHDAPPMDVPRTINAVVEIAPSTRPTGALWTSGQPLRARPLPHRASNRNRSGQLIWYINRSTQNVLDSDSRGPRPHASSVAVHAATDCAGRERCPRA